jgi:hypothetical protein
MWVGQGGARVRILVHWLCVERETATECTRDLALRATVLGYVCDSRTEVSCAEVLLHAVHTWGRIWACGLLVSVTPGFARTEAAPRLERAEGIVRPPMRVDGGCMRRGTSPSAAKTDRAHARSSQPGAGTHSPQKPSVRWT